MCVFDLIDFGMNIQEAGDAARYRHAARSVTGDLIPGSGKLYLESGIDTKVEEQLKKLGHKVVRTSRGGYGGYQAIFWDSDNGVYHGASEMRKDGLAIGY
ncbi:MAG: gamma-glutamyltransferase [Pseudomonadales bacterium]|nr:gamma-glutamyltransferase [Pseudomonadales bacterium]